MTVLSNLFIKEFTSNQTTVEGKTLTRPTLTYTDGVNVTYAVDVDIGREGVINANGDIGMLPLYNVPIASGSHSIVYADVGSPVMLSRAATGQWQVIGYAKTMPKSYTIVPVTVPVYCLSIPLENPPGEPQLNPPVLGDPVSIGQEVRTLTYEELSTYGTYGTTPYGAAGVFVGGVFTGVRVL